MEGPSSPSILRRATYYAIGLSFSGAVAFGLLEAVCRLFDPLGISYYPNNARWLDTLIVEADGYRNRPGLRGEFFGATVAINSIGLRDREIPPEPERGEFRILVMGDSFPFGIGVPFEDSIPQALERQLNENAPAGIRYRTVNMGVVSYNSEQELRQLETLGLGLHPRAVVLFYTLNDIEPKMWVFEKREKFWVRLAQRSYAASLGAFVFRNLKQKISGTYTAIDLASYRPDSSRWKTVDASLSAMGRRCREAGIPFVVFTFDTIDEPLSLVRAVGKREGFPVVDVAPSRDPRWARRDPRSLGNSVVDSHPNPEGGRIFATLVRERLVRLGVLPTG